MSEIVLSEVSREDAHNYLEENNCVFGDYVLRTSDRLGFETGKKIKEKLIYYKTSITVKRNQGSQW